MPVAENKNFWSKSYFFHLKVFDHQYFREVTDYFNDLSKKKNINKTATEILKISEICTNDHDIKKAGNLLWLASVSKITQSLFIVKKNYGYISKYLTGCL